MTPRIDRAAGRRAVGPTTLGLAFVLVVISAIVAAPGASGAPGAKSAVDAFLARLGGVDVRDIDIDATVALFDPAGVRPRSNGRRRLVIKLPGRQRLEQTIEGEREITLTVAGRTWVRRADGVTSEAPRGADLAGSTFLVPLRRTAAEVLTDWRAVGIRDDVSDEARMAGRTVTIIGARAGDHTSSAVWLDPDFGVIRAVTNERVAGAGALVDRSFSQHRPLAGSFYFPHRHETFVNGRLVVVVTVRSIALNTDPPDSLFDPDAFRGER